MIDTLRSVEPLTPHRRPRVGLVLGAGGVRGCAHAGVIGVLRDAGIEVDLIVGASVGSIFGLAMAAGISTAYLHSVIRDNTAFQLFRFYAAGLRTDRSNPIARMLQTAGGGKEFGDLAIPFAAVATDMESGETVVLNRGPVLPAVEASIALPFIARPAAIEGRYYLDGGLYSTAPVEVARALGAERVIAVCLGTNYRAPDFLSRRPWTQPVLHRLGTQRRPVRGRFHDQVRFGVRLYATTFEPPPVGHDADIAIWPDVGRITSNSMRGASYCLDAGIAAAREALPRILEWA